MSTRQLHNRSLTWAAKLNIIHVATIAKFLESRGIRLKSQSDLIHKCLEVLYLSKEVTASGLIKTTLEAEDYLRSIHLLQPIGTELKTSVTLATKVKGEVLGEDS